MADEPLGMRPGEDDGMDVGVGVDPVHQLLEPGGHFGAEHAERAAVDPDDQDGAAVLDFEMGLVCGGVHASSLLGPGGLRGSL